MKIHSFKRRPLSNSNIFYQNFMKLGHVVQYHNVFFKLDNGPYRTRLSRVMGPSGLQIYGGPGSLSHDFKIWPITFQGSGPS